MLYHSPNIYENIWIFLLKSFSDSSVVRFSRAFNRLIEINLVYFVLDFVPHDFLHFINHIQRCRYLACKLNLVCVVLIIIRLTKSKDGHNKRYFRSFSSKRFPVIPLIYIHLLILYIYWVHIVPDYPCDAATKRVNMDGPKQKLNNVIFWRLVSTDLMKSYKDYS
jgi:hypothetical protein